jgi:hypothetical protein
MKKKPKVIVISVFLVGALLISLFLINQNFRQGNLDRKAQVLIEKACDGNLKMSWQKRANLAAQANALNGKWLRLLDGVIAQEAFEKTNANLDRWREASGNDGAAYFYANSKMYSQYVAECSRLP